MLMCESPYQFIHRKSRGILRREKKSLASYFQQAKSRWSANFPSRSKLFLLVRCFSTCAHVSTSTQAACRYTSNKRLVFRHSTNSRTSRIAVYRIIGQPQAWRAEVNGGLDGTKGADSGRSTVRQDVKRQDAPAIAAGNRSVCVCVRKRTKRWRV